MTIICNSNRYVLLTLAYKEKKLGNNICTKSIKTFILNINRPNKHNKSIVEIFVK